MSRSKQIAVRSMFGHHTRRPLVLLRLGEEMAQIPPDQARQIGHWLLEAAEAAEQDGALMTTLASMGLDERYQIMALQVLRAARQKFGGDVTATESGEE